MGAQPPHAGGPLPRASASMGRTWGRGPPAMRVGASDSAASAMPGALRAPRTRGRRVGKGRRGEPQKKILPTTPQGWPRPAARRKPRAGFRHAPACRFLWGAQPRPVGKAKRRTPPRFQGSASSRWLDRWGDDSRDAWRKATSCECAGRHRRSEAPETGGACAAGAPGPARKGRNPALAG